MEIAISIFGYLLPVIASIITLLAIIGVRKLFDKFGLERSEKVDDMIDKYVHMGINAAEVVGEKYLKMRNVKMPGEDKIDMAIKTVMTELEQSGIKDVAEELIVNRIEHWLFEDKKVNFTNDHISIAGPWLRFRGHLDNI